MTDCVNGQTVPARVYTFFGHGRGEEDGRHRRRRRDQTIRAQSYALYVTGNQERRKEGGLRETGCPFLSC